MSSYYGRRQQRTWAGIIIAVLLVLVISIPIVIVTSTKNHVTFRVTDKQIMSTGSGNHHKYMIYTDHGVYQDIDSFLYLKFNSSDVFGKLQRGHTYNCETVGLRVPLFSSYRNLIKCSEV